MLTRRQLLGTSLSGAAYGLSGPGRALRVQAAQVPGSDFDLTDARRLKQGVQRSFNAEGPASPTCIRVRSWASRWRV